MPYGSVYRPKPYVYAPTNINVTKINVNSPVYAGSVTPRPKPYAPAARPPAAMPSATRPAATPATRPGATAAQRPTTYPATGSSATTQPARPPTGSGATRPASPAMTAAQRPASSPTPGMADYGSRGYNQPSNVRPNERSQTNASAFSGYQSGNAERAASQRGQDTLARNQARTPVPAR
jgi:hypothetical protein